MITLFQNLICILGNQSPVEAPIPLDTTARPNRQWGPQGACSHLNCNVLCNRQFLTLVLGSLHTRECGFSPRLTWPYHPHTVNYSKSRLFPVFKKSIPWLLASVTVDTFHFALIISTSPSYEEIPNVLKDPAQVIYFLLKMFLFKAISLLLKSPWILHISYPLTVFYWTLTSSP